MKFLISIISETELSHHSIKLNKSLRSVIKLLEKNPHLGVYVDVKNLRNLIQGDLNVFYMVREETIEIITIWDTRQDPEKLNLEE
ncbi:MAG: type II toxin-antitoxin system RelE/ParE family toxin [Verrucomicrobia bacterium]|nr:type II toxin-antitoxin system RelE/ParE family toxin [Prolixibacteraceae bacterium]